MLAHKLPDEKDAGSKTTETFYFTGQRMAEKAQAMEVWSDALMGAYFEAGGKYPAPSEKGRYRKINTSQRSQEPAGAIAGSRLR
jgi:hypothetical protein